MGDSGHSAFPVAPQCARKRVRDPISEKSFEFACCGQ